MSIEGLFIGVVILAAALVWIGAPLFGRESRRADEALIQKQRERLLMVYERVLTNLRDLDEDHSTGKMPTADYEAEREVWAQRGVQVLKALDQLDAQHTITPETDDEAIDRAIDAQIEDAIASFRAKAGS